MLYTVMFTSSYTTLYRVISTTMNQLIDVRCFKPHGTLMARNTSYKYWTNPIYRMYNPIEITSYNQ